MTGFTAISPDRARALIDRFGQLRVCVVGDVMLDRFVVGRVTRISPEAPVPVVRFEREYSRLGGAANVAQNLTALGAQVSLVGVVGNDDASRRLRSLLEETGISSDGLICDAGTLGGVVAAAGLTPSQPHLTPCASARRRMP